MQSSVLQYYHETETWSTLLEEACREGSLMYADLGWNCLANKKSAVTALQIALDAKQTNMILFLLDRGVPKRSKQLFHYAFHTKNMLLVSELLLRQRLMTESYWKKRIWRDWLGRHCFYVKEVEQKQSPLWEECNGNNTLQQLYETWKKEREGKANALDTVVPVTVLSHLVLAYLD